MRGRRRTWTIGGIGLIGCGVAGVLLNAVLGTPLTAALSIIVDALWAAAVLVFAIGTSAEDSIVARRPLGLISLILVAVWPLAMQLVGLSREATVAVLLIPWQVLTFAPLAFALVAVVQIGRTGVAPHPWRWAPAVALGVTVAVGLIVEAMFAAVDPASLQQVAGLTQALGVIGFLARTLGLGIVALLAVASERPASVAVYPPPNESP